ncbi:transmembrane protein, putative (macronuclear) [Tetrahymena thermophila SB210]|uniref:Transmembrane protein, putative n=1 Tax=Tetrahymena thermophila (strain SB210) TaxID=312017 RepID=W7XL57_TETTS|nr:transmembrane protein, putative [Tetrahymena thermophila SB210]EWS75709.1 transmembrane protein, putative [Tetrahymena thermophila SB210]|eukprot:XP_012651782.1 transmembrane protein, putative [Tetrahymena thermophila SB210]
MLRLFKGVKSKLLISSVIFPLQKLIGLYFDNQLHSGSFCNLFNYILKNLHFSYSSAYFNLFKITSYSSYVYFYNSFSIQFQVQISSRGDLGFISTIALNLLSLNPQSCQKFSIISTVQLISIFFSLLNSLLQFFIFSSTFKTNSQNSFQASEQSTTIASYKNLFNVFIFLNRYFCTQFYKLVDNNFILFYSFFFCSTYFSL